MPSGSMLTIAGDSLTSRGGVLPGISGGETRTSCAQIASALVLKIVRGPRGEEKLSLEPGCPGGGFPQRIAARKSAVVSRAFHDFRIDAPLVVHDAASGR